MSDTQLLTAEELAASLRIRPSTVRNWGRQGLIPTVRLAKKVIRYELQAVLNALRQQSAKGGDA